MVDLVANSEYTRIADVVAAMADAFSRRRAQAPDAELVQVQDKFVQFDLFPAFGWKLVHAGVAQALADNDARSLHEMLTKYIGLAYRYENRFDANGIQISSGTDHCAFVDLVVYAMALGEANLARRLLHAQRPLSRHGHALSKNAANLLVLLLNPGWAHANKSRQLAENFAASKSASKIDKAFIEFLLGVQADQRERRVRALGEFAALYTRSMWGSYKPFTQPLYLYGLTRLARHACPDCDTAGETHGLFDARWTALWAQYEARWAEFSLEADAFSGDLAFLRF